jgi:MFS family permease
MNLADVLKLSFFMYLLYGLGALPSGLLADRFGNRRILIIFFIGTGIGAIMTALSRNQISITVSLAVIGFFASMYHPSGIGLLSIGIKNRGAALGINGIAGNIGMISAPFAGGLLNWLLGWEATYAFIGILSILWGILTVLTGIDETPVHTEIKAGETTQGNNHKLKYFLILCVIMTISGVVYRANSIVMPAYLEFRAGFLWNFLKGINIGSLEGTKTVAATLLASFIYAIGIIGQFAGGKLADKYDLRWMYFAFHGLSLPFVIMMGIFSQQLLVISAAIYIFFALGMQPVENSLVAKFTPAKWRSTAYGTKFILVFGVGSIAVYMTGWIERTWNLETVYFFAAGFIALLVSLILVLIWTSRGTSCKNTE